MAFRVRAVALALLVALSGCDEALLVAEEPRATAEDAGTPGNDGSLSDAANESSPAVFVACGQSRCYDRTATTPLGTQNFFACCADEASSRCGLVWSPYCLALDQPGKLDSTCPDINSPVFGFFPGCCAATGTCAAYDTTFGCAQVPLVSQLVSCTYE
jgi:hypothetical protein